jgi:hypothetical protein
VSEGTGSAAQKSLTGDELTEGIIRALYARDRPAVSDTLQALAVVDPRKAEAFYDLIQMMGKGV